MTLAYFYSPGWEPVGSDWTRPKPSGWVPVNSSPSLTSPMCTFCHHVSESSTQPMTSASSLTASCRCRLTSLRSVVSGYYQLQQLWPAVRSLSEDASKTLIQAFVSCHMDYCNFLFFSISDGLMSRLQSVQNAAARLVTGTRCCSIYYTGYRYASASISSLPHLFIGCYPEILRYT